MAGAPIDFAMSARLAEFEFSLTFAANAPIDKFARGQARPDARREAGGAAPLRRGRLRKVPRRGGRVERDVQRLQEPRPRRAANCARFGVARATWCSTARRDEDFGARADQRRRRRSLQVPHVTAAQRGGAAGLLPQRRVHPLEDAIRHHLDVQARPATTTRDRPAWRPTSLARWARSSPSWQRWTRCSRCRRT